MPFRIWKHPLGERRSEGVETPDFVPEHAKPVGIARMGDEDVLVFVWWDDRPDYDRGVG